MWNDKFNIYEGEWLEVVFSSRNRMYGAYDLRRYSSEATNKALFIVIGLVAIFVGSKFAYDRMPKSAVSETVYQRNVPIELIDLIPEEKKEEEVILPKEQPVQRIALDPPAQDLIRFVEPVITDRSRVTEDVASQDELKDKMSARISLKKVDGGSFIAKGEFGPVKQLGSITGSATGDENGLGAEDSDKPFIAVEVMPNPPGGMAEFVKWVGKNYIYPEAALTQGIKGSVMISFVVEKDGSLSDIKIVRDLGFGTGEEALRVLKKAKKWRPGVQNGRPVRVAYTLPITLSTL
ncbi:energy transducer TonB [Sphingobacterium sp. LRF_L2]|uniref:energy transducer TonB n=1 Tax=Sphingobacterium sp. LRF_L2 TaxID=3369421 RepID=UPI003F5E5474